MRIGVVMPLGERRGGAERLLCDLLHSRAARRAEWHVWLLEPGPLAGELRRPGVRVSVVDAGRLRQPHRLVPAIARLAQEFRAARLDVSLAWMTKAQLYAGPAAALAGVRCVWFQHGLPDPPNRLDRLATAIPAGAVFACSEVSARAQARLRPRRPTSAIHPGADLSRFDPDALPPPAQARNLLGLPPGRPVIGTVGRLQRWKGMHVVLEAFPAVLRRHPDALCVLVGGEHGLEPDVPGLLRRRIEALRIADRVVLAGARDDIPLWMQAMDVFVHAADREPFGLVVVEAMALGKPVVAGASGGPPEIITPGENGELVPYRDAAGLAAAVHRLLADPARAARLGRAAASRALDFSAESFATRLLAALTPAGGGREAAERAVPDARAGGAGDLREPACG
jgi:glycosyltransferase involved in cell wall biosynthesis